MSTVSQRLTEFAAVISCFILLGCSQGVEPVQETPRGVSIERVGNMNDVEEKFTGPKLFLMGSGYPDTVAYDRYLKGVINGESSDVTVVAASLPSGDSSTPECDLLNGLDSVNSCTTFTVVSAAGANSDAVVNAIQQSGTVYFAGGNQCSYMNWRGSRLMDAVSQLFERGGGVGGGSAGLAIQAEWVYDGCTGSVRSMEALENPYDPRISLSPGVFSWPMLPGFITDSHFSERDRLGRLIAFQARIMEEQESLSWFGIGLDDESAVIVDKHGEASVFGGDTYVLNTTRPADTLNQGVPLSIDSVKVYRFTPGERFQLAVPSLSAEADIYRVDDGVLKSEP